MSDKIKVYQKPTCSKCRTTLGILRERGADFESINYYEKPLGVEELRKLIGKLGIAPRDLLRKGEQVYRDLGLAKRELSDDELIRLMVEIRTSFNVPSSSKETKLYWAARLKTSTNCCELYEHPPLLAI